MKSEGSIGEERFDESAPVTVAGRPRASWVSLAIAGIASTISLGVVVLAQPPLWIAALLATSVVVLGVVVLFHQIRRPSLPHFGVGAATRAVVLSGRDLSFDARDGAGAKLVLRLGQSFGVTLLANRSRTRATLVLTSTEGSFYAGLQVDDGERAVMQRLLATAYTVASDERALDAAAPDGFPLHLGATAFARLHDALLRLDPSASSRLCLSDVRGEAITLEGQRLAVGRRSFDLTVPLEWRGMLFRESGFGGSVAVYQGTHVRQGSTEVVFVSLMPALSAPTAIGDTLATTEPLLERAVLRDMSLMHEAAEEPPATDLRVAVERVFMLPLRAALSGARQRMSSAPEIARRDRPLRVS